MKTFFEILVCCFTIPLILVLTAWWVKTLITFFFGPWW